ncbi:hypothetical protein LGT39_03910 [Demequina sp. TTPB684]|uniref:hypothetical protein n=1 Tax=unclassified Demequina TaxID=2620311 RepID=UPI001CF52B20|nr:MULTISPECIES: hypothetical protein [unclassified Demequina]MCB2411993.1 hypothetical protein [Demequina sp. TTPB684]UPU88457.1 hypothetical protein LGT36_000590 [Demequina sp. TMPB413]
MNAPVSSWVTHAGREPADIVIREMDSWWQDARGTRGPEAMCRWHGSALHSLVLVHVDRAAHKRRHQATFVCKTPCGLTLEDHGSTPMSAIVRDDAYGPQPLRVVHSEPESAIGHAIAMVKGAESTLAVALATEAEFDDPDHFDLHRASLVDPLRDGVALAIIHVPLDAPESTDDAMAREDLFRAAGYAAYTIDLDGTEDDRAMHRHLAGLLEDVFDEVAGIKADAAARILMSAPLWPAVVIRTSPAWRRDHGATAVTGEIPVTSTH